MFDLFRSREKSVRYLLGGLLGLVALSMVTYLIPGAGGYGVGNTGDQTTVADIGGEKITTREVLLALQNATRNRSIPPGMEDFLLPQLVNSLVSERAMAYEAEKMGMVVTEDDLAQTIQGMIPSLYQDGKFIGKDAYGQLLAQSNLTIPEFERNVKTSMLVTRLRNMVADGVVVTPQEIETAYHQKNDKARIEYISFKPSDFASEIKPSDQDLQTYFTAHTAAYQVPEKRSIQMMVIDESKVASSIKPTDAELQAAYKANQDSYRVPERVHSRHILFKTQGKSADESAKLKKDAEDTLKALRGGADFAEMAKKKSDDPGSKDKGGDLGWLTKGQTVKNFENAAFTQKPNEIGDLVTTEYGYHIVQVLEHQQPHLRSFDEVKPELIAELSRRQATDKMQTVIDQAHAAVVKNPAQMPQIAQQFGAEYAKTDKIDPATDPLPVIGASQELGNALSGAAKGQVTAPVSVGNGRTVIAQVTDVTPAHPATYADVQNKVREDYVKQKSNELATKRANDAAAKAKSSGDLKAVAAEFHGAYKSIPAFSEGEAAEGIGLSSYVSDAFTKPAGTVVGPAPVPDQTIIYKVLGKDVADNAQLNAQRASLIETLKQRKARERVDLFEDGVIKKLTDSGKVKIYEDAVKRLATSARG